jgi:EAL domain-containing protein (putative c-di-GMP-specific phosphodiesterase class I)
MAFQPIVDVSSKTVFAYEALVRGLQNESAYSVLSQVTAENRYAFDQSCRVEAISVASRLGLPKTGARLSINFMPGAVYSPAACIQLTLKTARALDFPLDRIIFEITEGEEVNDPKHLQAIADEYRLHDFQVALDDFGAGYSGLNLLADLPADIVKLDMQLIRDIDRRPRAAQIVSSIAELCKNLRITLIAEGIETIDEFYALEDCGITIMQGYLLARPVFQTLPDFKLPRSRSMTQSSPSRIVRNYFPLLQDGAST